MTDRKINFVGEVWLNMNFNNKIKKTKIFVMRNTNNLFGTDAITKFNLWDLPISSFCNNIEEYKDDSQNIKKEIKKTFPEVFSEGLGRCTKMTAKIKLKKNVQQVFRKKRSIPFAAIDKIDKELERLTQCGVL